MGHSVLIRNVIIISPLGCHTSYISSLAFFSFQFALAVKPLQAFLLPGKPCFWKGNLWTHRPPAALGLLQQS